MYTISEMIGLFLLFKKRIFCDKRWKKDGHFLNVSDKPGPWEFCVHGFINDGII